MRAEDLVELIWGDEAPTNATKSLQVLVSRTRSVCGPDVIVRDRVGYRLGVEPGEVDSARLCALVRDARAALERDAVAAAELARSALALADGLPTTADDGNGPLSEVRRAAAADLAAAHLILARAAAGSERMPTRCPDSRRCTRSTPTTNTAGRPPAQRSDGSRTRRRA